MKKFKILTILFLGVACWPILAQQVTVKASLDSTVIAIGGQVGLNIEVTHAQNHTLQFPVWTDTLTHEVEVVKVGKIDSVIANGLVTIRQRLTLTSFDSGLHYIPPIVLEEGVNKFASQSLALNVVNPFEKVNPEEGIADIKGPIDTPFSWAELWMYLPYILGGLALVAAVVCAVLYFLRRKGKIELFVSAKPKDPAHVIALRELERIKADKLWQRNLMKEYYSGISDTLRRYIEERFHVSSMELTTDETLDALKQSGFAESRHLEPLKQILTTSDLVKFARWEPLPDENDLIMIHALFFINQTKVEELKSIEQQRAELDQPQSVHRSEINSVSQ